MLSPGTHHERVPRTVAENIALRREILSSAVGSPSAQAAVRRACAEDVLFFCNVFCHTFDPRAQTRRVIPFCTYPYQDRGIRKILWCLDHHRDLVIDKSRDMGASWFTCVVMDWLFLFVPETSGLMISRMAELVDGGTDDKGNSKSLFWKIDLIHKYLPHWLMPRNYVRKKFHFGNGDIGSNIDGEATTAAAAVGDRRTIVFIDEFSRIEQSADVLAGTADVSDTRIFNQTPWLSNRAARRLAQRTDVEKLTMHWWEHPKKGAGLYRYNPDKGRVEVLDKDYRFPPDYPFVLDGKLRSPEYDFQEQRRGKREMAIMWDISWDASGSQFFDPTVIEQHIERYARDPVWEGEVGCEGDTGKPLGLEKTAGGPLRLWVQPDALGRLPPGWYAVGADLSQGKGATNSCASVISCTTGQKVAEYVTPFLPPELFAARVVALCRMFATAEGDPAKLAWEAAGPGDTFGQHVLGPLGFHNVYYRKNPLARSGKEGDIAGWYPNRNSRRTLLEAYRAALGQSRMTNHSREALRECLDIHDAGDIGPVHVDPGEEGEADPSGAGVNHGDRVVADALAWMLVEPRLPRVGQKGVGSQELDPRSLAWRLEHPDDAPVDRWGDSATLFGDRL